MEVLADCPEPAEADISANRTAAVGIPGVDEVAPQYDVTDHEDDPHSEPPLKARCLSDISKVELAYRASELDEGFEQGEEQTAHNDTMEPLNDRPDQSDHQPIQLDADIPGFLVEFDDTAPEQEPVHAPIPAPIELQSTNEADADLSLNDHVDPVSCIGEDEDFSLSLELARAYLEIGDQEGAEEILKRALAGAPDPEPRRQMEELLIKIG
jgi:FimV-like protein